ncbi:putative acetyltransferase [Bacillus sp. THAF10]|uniref:GNAT family N-acetyltransferase n=1 Tax=Bacillus sp. THAF10 TaxID=2587848 RepID=UPI0012A9E4EE|nr:GNAT family N-acetyltransferase [Bacillus sp. THAF10]QFT88647.1 putative acetyltransferase [Bacillus sp. THAF10]
MYQIKRLSECTLNQAVEAWNKGFEGYFFDAKMDVDRFSARLGMENISASFSLVAFDGENPIGLLLSGVRTIGKNKVAWNGGTGVATAYRRKGVGKLLLDHALEIYSAEGVTLSTLEAIGENEKAISLYQAKGYEVVDKVIHLSTEGQPEFNDSYPFMTVYNSASAAPHLSLYQTDTPWQSQWWCMKEGQTLQLLSDEGETVAYAMFKRQYTEDGTLNAVIVTHCFIKNEMENHDRVLESMFSQLFPYSATNYQRMVAFFQPSNMPVYQYLLEKGFEHKIEQVWMKKSIKSPVPERN